MKRAAAIFLASWIVFSSLGAVAESAGTLVDIGNRHFAEGEYDKALESYDKALTERPDSAEILFNKGSALFMKGEYEKAREAYQAAALQTKDLSLEASAHYNLGNTLFAEGQSGLHSDPRKALSQWEQSTHHFQEALRMDPQFKEAAQNLEVTRLSMKELADRIKKAEEAAKERQQRRDEIQKALKEVTKEQESEIAQNDALQNKSRQNPGGPHADEMRQLAEKQAEIRDKTGKIAENMKDLAPKQPPAPQTQHEQPSSPQDALEHLAKAMEAQGSAAEKLGKQALTDAREDQETAVRSLKEALNASGNSEKDGKQGAAPQQKDQKNGQESGDEDRQETAPPNPTGEEKENPAKGTAQQQPDAENPQVGQKETREKGDGLETGSVFGQSPESIIREEKENRLLLHRDSQGGIKPVDKDW